MRIDIRLLRVLSHLSVEIIFAVLPVFVLSMIWLVTDETKTEAFWHGPELSMTSCVLFGLTLARLQQGFIVGAHASSGNIKSIASLFSLVSVLPLLGVIASTILISAASITESNITLVSLQTILLILALLCCVIFGGYGVDRFDESEDK